MADEFSWLTILQIGGLSGVVSAGAKWGLDLFTENRRRTLEASYAALRVVVTLEKFTSACEAHLRDRAVGDELVGHDAGGTLPKLDDFPGGLDWRHFDPQLAMLVLGLPARIEAAQSDCDRVAWEERDYWASEREAIRLGLEAWELAGRVRGRYSLGVNKQLAAVGDFLSAEKERRAVAAAAARAKWQARTEAVLHKLGDEEG